MSASADEKSTQDPAAVACVCHPICAPIENVIGTGETGCCCCLDVRDGLVLQGCLQGLITLAGFIFQVYTVASKGLGIPAGYPPEFPPYSLLAVEEIWGFIQFFLSAVILGLATWRAFNRELKSMWLVLRIFIFLFFVLVFSTVVLSPILSGQMCGELENESTAACAPYTNTNKTACTGVLNPMGWGAKGTPRCAWSGLPASSTGQCNHCGSACSRKACWIGAVVFELIFMLPNIIWLGYYIRVMNSYIVNYTENEGQSLVLSTREDEMEEPGSEVIAAEVIETKI